MKIMQRRLHRQSPKKSVLARVNVQMMFFGRPPFASPARCFVSSGASRLFDGWTDALARVRASPLAWLARLLMLVSGASLPPLAGF